MRRIHLLLFLCISSFVSAQQTQVPEIQFQSVLDPLKWVSQTPTDEPTTSGLPVIRNVGPDWSFVLARGSDLYCPAIRGTVSALADINLC
jgi:hypothetical protein